MIHKNKGLSKRKRIGSLKKKIILLLWAGLALGLSHSPRQHFRILSKIPEEWKKIDRQALERAIKSLYESHLIETRSDGERMTLILNEQGKKLALSFDIENMKIVNPNKWDYKWRIVLFDIPEKMRRLRDSLRLHFNELGFMELQKSVFIHPYPCEKEIEFLVEFYNARKYVRFILADQVDNELHFKKKFNLL